MPHPATARAPQPKPLQAAGLGSGLHATSRSRSTSTSGADCDRRRFDQGNAKRQYGINPEDHLINVGTRSQTQTQPPGLAYRPLKDEDDATRPRCTQGRVDGIQGTEVELDTISTHVLALEDILKHAKKPRRTFATVTLEGLKSAGVVRKRLVFDPAKVAELGKALPPNTEAEFSDLHARIKKIYAR